MRWFLIGLSLWMSAGLSWGAAHTRARLLFDHVEATPGQQVWAMVELNMDPGWHTYWRNGGDSGSATEIKWTLPAGWTAGSILWPVPEKIIEEDLTSYIYHGVARLLVPLQVAASAAPGAVSVGAEVSWVECKESCVPGAQTLTASIAVGPTPKVGPDEAAFAGARQRLPVAGTALAVRAKWEGPGAGDTRYLLIETGLPKPSGWMDFFSDQPGPPTVHGGVETRPLAPDRVVLRKAVTRLEGTQSWPSEFSGLIVGGASAQGPLTGHEVRFRVPETDAAPAAVIAATALTPAQPVQPAVARASWATLLPMLGLAFLGGLILNIMPCVLPVIALKILGFVQQSREEPREVRRLGVIYTLGVVTSFILLAGMVVGIQQAGRVANWGSQFQNPQFLVGMTVLVTLVALNLFGVFEVNLGGTAMSAAGDLAAKEGTAGAFFNGILATALATPCTAPFLGVALGFAFAQPPGVIVLMFVTVALGLAAPYLILSWQPQWLRFLPKPGLWMESFKVAMGFPMLATAMWLFWLTQTHFDRDGALWLGLLLVIVGAAAWVWGEFAQRARRGHAWGMAVSLALVVFAYGYVLENRMQWRHPEPPVALAAASGSAPTSGHRIPWQVWSQQAVAQARAAGHPVVVDFTADWCLTCRLNEKRSIEIPEVRRLLAETGTVAFRADHTRQDPVIAEELRRYGRAGVPLVMVFPADPAQPPIILGEFLPKNALVDALTAVASTKTARLPAGTAPAP